MFLDAEASAAIATKQLRAIAAATRKLRDLPNAGIARDELGAGLRATFHPPYVIYYRVVGPELFVVRVLHGARDAAAIAERGGFT